MLIIVSGALFHKPFHSSFNIEQMDHLAGVAEALSSRLVPRRLGASCVAFGD